MTMAQMKQDISEANRRRYEELRAAGQELTPKGLPEATALDGASIAPGVVISREQVPAGWYTSVRLRRGEADRRRFRVLQRVADRLARGRDIRADQLRRYGKSIMECCHLEGARPSVGHGACVPVADRDVS